MAYDTNSLVTVIPRLGTGEGGANAGSTGAIHVYRSADPVATVIAAAYVDDGALKGIKVNDIVLIIDDNIPTIDVALVTVVDTSTNADGDVTMINGT